MPTFKIVLEYDGTAYAGWQRQPDQPTIQQRVEDAIAQVIHQAVPVISAGRTDAGVHARGQVASFRCESPERASDWLRALNAILPKDISVLSVEQTAEDFHARYAATRKIYEYRILNRPERSALEHGRAWHLRAPLDLAAMQRAADHLCGRHDFSSFEGTLTDNDDPIVDMQQLAVRHDPPIVTLTFTANRFLKHMVRAIVGTLVEVGQGKRQADSLRQVLEANDRRQAGQTAPAHGLYLVSVEY
ncbi:MAG TPA: tRNA pseudouridine(38-40) synthase TruA [Nitrospirales bacterium]|nr:tRNA pseudouridine(38-40) synthase TruA [Nitrospirales bacterium]